MELEADRCQKLAVYGDGIAGNDGFQVGNLVDVRTNIVLVSDNSRPSAPHLSRYGR